MQAEAPSVRSPSESPARASVRAQVDVASDSAPGLSLLRDDLEALCALGARDLAHMRVERGELTGILDRLTEHLDGYHAELEGELASFTAASGRRESRYVRLLRRHVQRCGERQRAEITRLVHAATCAGQLESALRACWAAALALRIELEDLTHDVDVVIAAMHGH